MYVTHFLKVLVSHIPPGGGGGEWYFNIFPKKGRSAQHGIIFRGLCLNPFTPELKKCILPTFQKAIV